MKSHQMAGEHLPPPRSRSRSFSANCSGEMADQLQRYENENLYQYDKQVLVLRRVSVDLVAGLRRARPDGYEWHFIPKVEGSILVSFPMRIIPIPMNVPFRELSREGDDDLILLYLFFW